MTIPMPPTEPVRTCPAIDSTRVATEAKPRPSASTLGHGRTVLCLAIALVFGCEGGSSRKPSAETAGNAIEARVENLLADYSGEGQPGACLLVRHGGATLFERCFGMANLEEGLPADPQTNFRLASVTKQLTAMAVIQLVDEGVFDYETKLTEIFAGFPAYGDRITVRHLMTHTSGLIDYESLLPEDQTEQVKDADVLRLMMEQDSTYFEPGSEFRYCNSGYAVLAMAIEGASGMRFADFLAARIFQPLEMRRTVAHEEGVSKVTTRAFGYNKTDDGWEFSDQSPTSAVLGDGGVYSSIEDLGRWMEVIEGRKTLVDPEALRRAFEPTILESGQPTEYGFGWYVDQYDGRSRYRHSGSTRGFRNNVQRFPQEDLTIVFLSNRNERAATLIDSIVDVALEAALPDTAKPKEAG
jgi:CubicO group peptidase (beta-lactamase class C family)